MCSCGLLRNIIYIVRIFRLDRSLQMLASSKNMISQCGDVLCGLHPHNTHEDRANTADTCCCCLCSMWPPRQNRTDIISILLYHLFLVVFIIVAPDVCRLASRGERMQQQDHLRRSVEYCSCYFCFFFLSFVSLPDWFRCAIINFMCTHWFAWPNHRSPKCVCAHSAWMNINATYRSIHAIAKQQQQKQPPKTYIREYTMPNRPFFERIAMRSQMAWPYLLANQMVSLSIQVGDFFFSLSPFPSYLAVDFTYAFYSIWDIQLYSQ